MSTSRNMPARFKSRTHLKHTVKMRDWNNRQRMVYRLEVVKRYADSFYDRLSALGLSKNPQQSKYGIASAKVRLYEAKHRLLDARKFRKSVVLPRLP